MSSLFKENSTTPARQPAPEILLLPPSAGSEVLMHLFNAAQITNSASNSDREYTMNEDDAYELWQSRNDKSFTTHRGRQLHLSFPNTQAGEVAQINVALYNQCNGPNRAQNVLNTAFPQTHNSILRQSG